MAADALSRLPSAEVLLLAISVEQSDMLALVQAIYAPDPFLQGMVQGTTKLGSKYQLVDGYLRRKSKLVIGPDKDLRSKILSWVHNSPTGGHAGRDATLKKVQQLFY